MYALAIDRHQYERMRWRAPRRFDNRVLPPRVRDWLLDEGSLTERLVVASGNRFAVHVMRQCWERPLGSERRALGMRDAGLALVREVELRCDGVAWVAARSILPATSLDGALRHLRRFGARSLGAQLFAARDLRREGFEVARLERGEAPALWARRSVFYVHGQPLLVQEVFLPACRLGSL